MSVRPGDFFMFVKVGDALPDYAVWAERMRQLGNQRAALTAAFPGGAALPPPPSLGPPGQPVPNPAPAVAGGLARGVAGELAGAGGRYLQRNFFMSPITGGLNAAAAWGRDDANFGPAPQSDAADVASGATKAVASVIPGWGGAALHVAPEIGAAGGAAAGRATSGWELPSWLAGALGVQSAGTGQAAELGERAQSMMADLSRRSGTDVNPETISQMRQQFSQPGKGPKLPAAAPAVKAPEKAPEEGFVDASGKYHSPAWTITNGGVHGPANAGQALAAKPPAVKPVDSGPFKIQGAGDVAKWEPGKPVEVGGAKAGPNWLDWSKKNPLKARETLSSRLPDKAPAIA